MRPRCSIEGDKDEYEKIQKGEHREAKARSANIPRNSFLLNVAANLVAIYGFPSIVVFTKSLSSTTSAISESPLPF